MANLQNFKDLRDALNSETNRIAAKIEELLARQDSSSLSTAEEQEIHDEFVAVVERLKVVGADPQDPIPPVV